MTLLETVIEGDPHVLSHNQERERINALQNMSDPIFLEAVRAEMTKSLVTRASVMLGKPMHWDNFARPDVADLNGLKSPSGHTYQTSTDGTSHMAIVDGKMVPTGVTETGAPSSSVLIAYLSIDEPLASIAAEWEWLGGDTALTDGENVLVGTPKTSYGAGSLQLSIYAGERPSFPGINWRLFVVQNPSVSPYTTIDEGPLDIEFDRSGSIRYRMAMHRTDLDQITLELPDGSVHVVNNTTLDPVSGYSYIRTYWGGKPGWQLRRNFDTDGYARFTSIATAAAYYG